MRTRTFILMFLVFAVAGCTIRLPKLPKRIKKPETAVVEVRLVEFSEKAARYDVDVVLNNLNDIPLPLTHAKYTLTLGGKEYASDTVPNATLPAKGTITITLPAVLATVDGLPPVRQGRYDTEGTVTMTPEGQVRQLLYEMGIPKPKAEFSGEGDSSETPFEETE